MACKCDDNSDPCATMFGGQGFNLNQKPSCQSTLLTPQAEADIRAAKRLNKAIFDLSGLVAGTSATPVVVAANSMFRAFIIQDLVSNLANMDDVEVTIYTYDSEKPQIDVFGGRFSRTNASDCITGCGMGLCGGPLDSITINVTNISGANFPAAKSLTLQYRIAYPGEPDYATMCSDCTTTGTGTGTVQKVEP